MYKIVVVDDEPAAVSLITNVIKKKCRNFEVQGTAYDGREALNVIRRIHPDVVLTDVRMPVMDGIELVRCIREEYPDMLVVILSGYSEFEYAKRALFYNVEDYILKPLDIPEFEEAMQKIREKLDKRYYQERNQIISAMINRNHRIPSERLKRYFRDERYYAALWRDNALPRRFHTEQSEVFSENSPIIVYGRDEMEGFILCPESVVDEQDFVVTSRKISAKYQSCDMKYRTMIILNHPFGIEEIHRVMSGLRRMLNSTAVIGITQTIISDDPDGESTASFERVRLSSEAEKVIKSGSIDNIISVLTKYISIWEKEKCPELWVESQVRHIFYQVEKREMLLLEHAAIEYLTDDAFYEALSMEDLLQTLISILEDNRKSGRYEEFQERQKLFYSITGYLETNLKEQLTVQDVCYKFGISKTTLSKAFHENADRSFHNYFTWLRVEKAKSIMENNRNCYIRDVAEEVGYDDQFYFSRVFKTMTGVSPSDYLLKDPKTQKKTGLNFLAEERRY